MQLKQLLKERRSIHKFQDRAVSVELIQELLDTAVWVPNHRMTQPWRFIIVHEAGRKRIEEICRKFGEQRENDPAKKKESGQKFYEKFMSAPLLIVVAMKEHTNPATREEDYASTSCVIHNFGLLAWEQGIGMIWKTSGLIYEAGFREALGIQPEEKIVGTLHVGYPAAVPPAQKRIPAAERTTIIDQE